MPVFLRNLGLEFMATKNGLLDEYMMPLFKAARPRSCELGRYYVSQLPSGVEFIFQVIPDGDDLRVVGVDTHVGGPCVWYGTPFMRLQTDSGPMTLRLAFSNEAKSAVFVANVMNAGVLPVIDEKTRVEMQVVAFPAALEIYKDRRAYENAMTEAAEKGDGTPLIIADGQPFPYNFMMKYNPDATDEQKRKAGREDLLLLCGKVLAVEERKHGIPGHEDASMTVATISTVFGHLDVVFSKDMLAGVPCGKGDYLVCDCLISADVALGQYEGWAE